MNLATEFKNLINSELEKHDLKLVLDYSKPEDEYFEYYLDCDECDDVFFNAGVFEFKVKDAREHMKIFRFRFAADEEHKFYKLRIDDVERYCFSECLFGDDEDPREWYIDIEKCELYFVFVDEHGEKQFKVIDFAFYLPSNNKSEKQEI